MLYKDQINRNVILPEVPKRIISLVPSQTELLVDLGMLDSIVGVTKFCVHPSTLRKQKTIVGGTKKVKYDTIKALRPDIILCNKEENTKEIVNHLQKEYPVYVSDIYSIPEALELITQYGEIFKKQNEAMMLINKITAEKESFDAFVRDVSPKKVAYFIWKNPWMVASKNTFIDKMLELNGFSNVFEDRDRYPEITEQELMAIKDLDMVLLSSEPYPFSEKHIDEIKSITNATVKLVDGEYFSWYGSRLAGAFSYFRTLHN